MFERELTLYAFNLNYLKAIMADIDESDLMARPFEGANPPVWILGHLALATDSAARLLGLEAVCPRPWRRQFAPGTNPADLQPPLPTKSELMAAIENGHRRVSEAAAAAAADVMNEPHNVGLLKPTKLKTKGGVVAHLMTTHIAFHLAQLSACRRKAGKGPIV